MRRPSLTALAAVAALVPLLARTGSPSPDGLAKGPDGLLYTGSAHGCVES